MANRDITTLGSVLKTILEGEDNTNFLTDADRTALDALQTNLDGKSDVGHGHVIADVSGLETALLGKADDVHGHVISDVTGLQTALDAKSAVGHGHTSIEITDFEESVHDVVGALISGQTSKGIRTVYDDAAGQVQVELYKDDLVEHTDIDPTDVFLVFSTVSGTWKQIKHRNLRKLIMPIAIANGDTSLVARTGAFTFRAPFKMYLTAVRASLTGGSTSGNVQVDVNVEGTSIFTTPVTIDANEKTSTTAATPSVLATNPTLVNDDAEITVDVDLAGANASGLKVLLIGYEA